MEIFRKLNEERGITIAFVTHEHDVAAYTRRIVSLRDGQIISDTPNVPVYEQQHPTSDSAATDGEALMEASE
jgi:putative ABC transport system ATP-binding protein